jgi:DNA-binding MarR family transcriptional regulator
MQVKSPISNCLIYRSIANKMIADRKKFMQLFPANIIADPALDILLDLYVAKIDEKNISISSSCISTNVPQSTALRWLNILCEYKLLRRHPSKKDGRISYVELTDESFNRMTSYFDTVVDGHAMQSLAS